MVINLVEAWEKVDCDNCKRNASCIKYYYDDACITDFFREQQYLLDRNYMPIPPIPDPAEKAREVIRNMNHG